MQRSSLVIRFEGDAGDGILTMGMAAARCAARAGYHVYTYTTFLAVVRGGQSTFQLHLGVEPLLSQGDAPDVLVALNHEAVRVNAPILPAGALVLHAPFQESIATLLPSGVAAREIDFAALAKEASGNARGANITAAGVMLALLGLDEETALSVIGDMFRAKGEDVCAANQNALDAGWRAGMALVSHDDWRGPRLPRADGTARLLMSGNEAVALGALTAGIRFFAGYPITPATEIMEWLAKCLPRVGGVMLQAEDEIASLGMCIGAAYGGVPSMTATSGPGLSLMAELIGLAGMMETPLVIADVQRAGPSTGMPTKEGQGDLLLAVSGTHGESPRIVLAPRSVSDCFDQTVRAVNLAHRFHVPVLLLSSQSLSHSMQTIDPPDPDHIELYQEPLYRAQGEDDDFQRFAPGENGGPSLRSIPGTPGGMHRAGGLEHDDSGQPDFDPELRRRMVARRRARMQAITRAVEQDADADTPDLQGGSLALVAWGASASVARGVARHLRERGADLSCFFPRLLWPLPDAAFEQLIGSGARVLAVCELNDSGQLAGLIKARYAELLAQHGVRVISVLKDDGLPFTPSEIVHELRLQLEALHGEHDLHDMATWMQPYAIPAGETA